MNLMLGVFNWYRVLTRYFSSRWSYGIDGFVLGTTLLFGKKASYETIISAAHRMEFDYLKKENILFQLANQQRFLHMIPTCVNKGSEKCVLCYAARGPLR